MGPGAWRRREGLEALSRSATGTAREERPCAQVRAFFERRDQTLAPGNQFLSSSPAWPPGSGRGLGRVRAKEPGSWPGPFCSWQDGLRRGRGSGAGAGENGTHVRSALGAGDGTRASSLHPPFPSQDWDAGTQCHLEVTSRRWKSLSRWSAKRVGA